MSIALTMMPLVALKTPKAGRRLRSAKTVSSEFDGKNPVLIDETLAIVAGESRYWAANELNREDILIVIIPGLSPAQKAKLKASDDAMAKGKRWTAATVRRKLKLIGYDLPQPAPVSAGAPGWNRSFDTRFKPGQSGNRGGRPKPTVSDKSLSEILREPRRVMIDGRAHLMTVREEMERRLIDSAAGGNVFAMQRTLSRLDKLYPLEHESIMERINRTSIEINFVKSHHKPLEDD